MNTVIGLLFIFLGVVLLEFGIFLLKYIKAREKALRFIQENHIEYGVYAKQHMVIDKETGLCRMVSVPTEEAIKLFL